MTQELIERLRAKAGQYDEYDWHSVTELEAAAALERLTAERDALKVKADKWQALAYQARKELAIIQGEKHDL